MKIGHHHPYNERRTSAGVSRWGGRGLVLDSDRRTDAHIARRAGAVFSARGRVRRAEQFAAESAPLMGLRLDSDSASRELREENSRPPRSTTRRRLSHPPPFHWRWIAAAAVSGRIAPLPRARGRWRRARPRIRQVQPGARVETLRGDILHSASRRLTPPRRSANATPPRRAPDVRVRKKERPTRIAAAAPSAFAAPHTQRRLPRRPPRPRHRRFAAPTPSSALLWWEIQKKSGVWSLESGA